MIYNFGERNAFSKGRRLESDEATLRAMFPKCVSVEKTDLDTDRAGVDYIITLRRGAIIRVDAKARSEGCKQWWRNGPEIPVETWSVMPGGKYSTPPDQSKVGWTLDESKDVDLILFTFHPSDHEYAYARPFPLLREACRRNFAAWSGYKRDVQTSEQYGRRWQSECHFVPLAVVDRAISDVSRSNSPLARLGDKVDAAIQSRLPADIHDVLPPEPEEALW